jgi:hypothetical protein
MYLMKAMTTNQMLIRMWKLVELCKKLKSKDYKEIYNQTKESENTILIIFLIKIIL